MIIKYTSIGFILAFFTYITIVGLKDSGKPVTCHHLHATKPEDEHKRDYIVEEKIPPHVKRENIIFEVFMGVAYEG
jgi:hypothetical protein